MNKAFTKTDKIILDELYTLSPDDSKGIILTFAEMRKKVNKKTDLEEDFLFESSTYHPRICQALKEYVNKTLNNSKTLEEIIEKEDRIFSLISEIDKNFKQFE